MPVFQTTPRPLIYAPTMHKELAPFTAPPGVLFLRPGLPGQQTDADFFLPAAYPFSPAEAKVVLVDLLALGEAFEVADDPALWTGAAERPARVLRSSLSGGEKAALGRFATEGGYAGTQGASENNTDSPFSAAQKILLLAWDLEERLLELAALRETIAAAGQTLALSLAANAEEKDESDRSVPQKAAFFTPPPDGIQNVDWRLSLAAMAAFLPPESVIVTAHSEMRQSMRDAGMLQPLPEDTAELLDAWPPALRAATLWANLPLWRILGHTRPPENKPYLLHAPEILICPTEAPL